MRIFPLILRTSNLLNEVQRSKAAAYTATLFRKEFTRSSGSRRFQPPEPTICQGLTVPSNVFDLFAGHEIGRELKAMSKWLDEHSDLLELVAGDLLSLL